MSELSGPWTSPREKRLAEIRHRLETSSTGTYPSGFASADVAYLLDAVPMGHVGSPCNICGTPWPRHDGHCSYAVTHARLEQAELLLRREWWLGHGCDFPCLYGDDGEMQCGCCHADFKRTPIPELREHVFNQRLKRASES